MISWILIPSYLWKNTCKRWIENPISPLSKIIVATLLSLLAILILVFFLEMEAQLQKKLMEVNSYSVRTEEFTVKSQFKSVTYMSSLLEEKMIRDRFPEADYTIIRQPTIPISWKGKGRTGVVIYREHDQNLAKYNKGKERSQILFLNRNYDYNQDYSVVTVNGVKMSAKNVPMPDLHKDFFNKTHMLAIPEEMAPSFCQTGIIITMIADFSTYDQVARFVKGVKAYYKAQNRRVTVHSALHILDSIQKIKQLRGYVRIGVVVFCGVILAIILGTIAWLEFLQESYLMALIRSFGVPRFFILQHAFWENVLLISGGICLSLYAWPYLYDILKSEVKGMNLRDAKEQVIPLYDMSILFIAGGAGVVIAMIPIAIGLRKPIGRVLS